MERRLCPAPRVLARRDQDTRLQHPVPLSPKPSGPPHGEAGLPGSEWFAWLETWVRLLVMASQLRATHLKLSAWSRTSPADSFHPGSGEEVPSRPLIR